MRMDKLTTKFQMALADAQSLAVGADHQFIPFPVTDGITVFAVRCVFRNFSTVEKNQTHHIEVFHFQHQQFICLMNF